MSSMLFEDCHICWGVWKVSTVLAFRSDLPGEQFVYGIDPVLDPNTGERLRDHPFGDGSEPHDGTYYGNRCGDGYGDGDSVVDSGFFMGHGNGYASRCGDYEGGDGGCRPPNTTTEIFV